MLTVQNVELRFGARLLMSDVSFRVAAGDKIGLVGRNGSGKTTLTRMLSGDGRPASGKITSTGTIGYLPQDPRIGDVTITARDRILSARGLDDALRRMRAAEDEMGSDDPEVAALGMKRYTRADADFGAGGGYAAESEAATIATQSRPAPAGAGAAAQHAVRRSAPTHRAGPHPVLRRRHPAARRADQPPRRRLRRVAARIPRELPRRARGHQPRRRAARADRHPGAAPRREPGRDRRLQHGLAVRT